MFNKYRSIENSYREKFLYFIKTEGFGDLEYVVQEKAHGSNLSYITTDGINFSSAKRGSLIDEGETFYNQEKILQQLKPKFSNIWNKLKQTYSSLEQLTIFGEVIGGSYPHPDVKADNKSLKVQRGVFYSPTNEFYAFDILINGDCYLDVDETNSLFEQENLLHAQTLFRGSLSDCLNYSNTFESTISSLLNLPEITPNICEGTIVRPVITSYLANDTRVILKNKNEKFSEKNKVPKTKTEVTLSDKVAHLKELILAYVTENRLDNVLSHMGEVTIKDMGKIIGLFSKDVVDDFSKDHEEEISEIDKNELKFLRKSIAEKVRQLILKRL